MAVIEIGRLCVKLAGRDAGKECLIVEDLKNNQVLIDGNTRRRKCNLAHLEFLPRKASIKKGASHEEVVKALEEVGIKVRERGKKFVKKKKEVKDTSERQPFGSFPRASTERGGEKKEEKKPLFSLGLKKPKEEKPKEEKPKEKVKEEKPKKAPSKKPAKK